MSDVEERAANVRATLRANPVLRMSVEYALAPEQSRENAERAIWDALVLACMYGMKHAAAEIANLHRKGEPLQ